MAKLDYAKFIAGQTDVYNNKFRDTTLVQKDGIKISGAVSERHQGYIIALRHPLSITETMGKFGERIVNTVPSFAYGHENAHTTLFIFGLVKNGAFAPEEATLNKLARSARYAAIRTLTVNYPEWLYNQDSVIVAGMSTPAFCETIDDIAAASAQEGLELRLPWGAHITAARYTQARPASELSDFFKLMKEAPALGLSKPTRIEVGHFSIDDQTCTLNVYDSIPLH